MPASRPVTCASIVTLDDVETTSSPTNRSGVLASLIGHHAARDGVTQTPIKGLRLYKSSHPTSIQAAVYDPSLILVAQGRKQTYLAGKEYTYDPDHYLILSVPLPVHSQVRIATPDSPFLSMAIIIEPAELSALILEMGETASNSTADPVGISVSSATGAFFDAAIRLLQTLDDPLHARILAPLYIREIFYHALRGKQGEQLRAIALRQGYRHRIAHVLNRIHTIFDEPMDVPSLAQDAGMSVSTFHHHFKEVTSLPPLQYVKSIRLHKARSLMLYEGMTASQAAAGVGYASASQFSREFRRLFGRPPGEEVARLQTSLPAESGLE